MIVPLTVPNSHLLTKKIRNNILMKICLENKELIVFLSINQKALSINKEYKKRELFPENENVICYGQYDRNKKLPTHNILVDSQLKNREGNLEFNWNPNYKGL